MFFELGSSKLWNSNIIWSNSQFSEITLLTQRCSIQTPQNPPPWPLACCEFLLEPFASHKSGLRYPLDMVTTLP